MKHYADYFLLLSPNAHVSQRVAEYKHYAESVIGPYDSQYSKAHISVRQIQRQKAFMTEPTLHSLSKGLATLPPVTLTVDGFDYFNHGEEFKTIYARLRSDHATTQWFKGLKKHLSLKEFMVPHITITRNIPVDDFNRLWPYFKAINWIEDFTVSELTILQRESFTAFKSWEPFITLPFEARHLITTLPKVVNRPPVKVSAQSGQMKLF